MKRLICIYGSPKEKYIDSFLLHIKLSDVGEVNPLTKEILGDMAKLVKMTQNTFKLKLDVQDYS